MEFGGSVGWGWDLYLLPFLDLLLCQTIKETDQCMQEYRGHVPNFIADCKIYKSSLELQQSNLTEIRLKKQLVVHAYCKMS